MKAVMLWSVLQRRVSIALFSFGFPKYFFAQIPAYVWFSCRSMLGAPGSIFVVSQE